MKKQTLTEEAPAGFRTFFDEETFTANLPVISKKTNLQNSLLQETAAYPDRLLSAIKWIFLYFPGTAAIHFIMMGFALSFYYGDWFIELFLGMLGIFAVATFMIMFGIGKLLDLRYLKVVFGIFLTSSLLAVFYSILIVFIPGDFFGFFTKITLFVPVLAGYFVKRSLDVEKDIE